MGRTAVNFTVRDSKKGRVRFDVFDRISADDIMVHLVRRELFRIAGGTPPGDDVDPSFRDFVTFSGTIPGD